MRARNYSRTPPAAIRFTAMWRASRAIRRDRVTRPGRLSSLDRRKTAGFTRNPSGKAKLRGPLKNFRLTGSLESRRTLAYHSEGAFQGQACVHHGTFLEQAADQGHAVGDATRRVKRRQGMIRVDRKST